VSLLAGKDLTMAEVNRVMEQVKRQCGHAQIIMGAAVDAALKEKLCVTVIAAKQSATGAAAAAATPAVSEPVRLSGRGGQPAPAVPPHRELVLGRGVTRPRRAGAKMVQSQLPLTIVSKGRFDKSEPTLHHGEDLDVPTFIRRGVPMN